MKKLFITIAISLLVISQGCKKFTDGDKISPNSPGSVTAALLLSNCELAVFAAYGGNLSRTASIFTQQSSGNTDQAFIYEKYGMVEGDYDNEWQNLYSSGLINTKKLMETAGAANPRYNGIAKVLRALMIGAATDLWGDVPYSQALKGEEYTEASRKPVYDKQEDVIKAIQTLLTEAIADLGQDDSKNILLPGADDYIFGGDKDKWIRTAWMLKARYEMRISKKSSTAAQKTLDALTAAYTAGLAGSDDDCNMIFGTNANEYNQWYAFCKVEREGYIRMGAKLVNMMNAINDPRLPSYCALSDTTAYLGTPAGEAEMIAYASKVSTIGNYYASPDASLPLITYVEAKFLEAEAKLGTDKAGAAKAYNDAVIEHITKVTGSAPDAAYITANASEDASTITLEKIMNQKYIALFTQIEVYNDWRRTGFPTLTKATGATTEIPRRLPNILEERQYNPNATIVSDMSVPVWWDSN
ncbi:MAG: SusD/RagB family nutrient-binding outer membrane lipoprotein [Bacteroidetes bacterium]|nr:SusD/RagB family nutrient-binding outer membrane lipoprotein [Bacteroidota bacterium]